MTCAQVRRGPRDGAAVAVHPDGRERERRPREVTRAVAASPPVYGRTTGVRANRSVTADDAGHGLRLLPFDRNGGRGAPPLSVPRAARRCRRFAMSRRGELHRNAVQVNGGVVVGSLKSNKNRTVVLPAFVMDAVAATCQGKGRAAIGGDSSPCGSGAGWAAAVEAAVGHVKLRAPMY
jgi:hypothetical protein